MRNFNKITLKNALNKLKQILPELGAGDPHEPNVTKQARRVQT